MLPSTIDPEEPLTRYIREVMNLHPDGKVKAKEFMPRAKYGNTTSVFRILSLRSEEIWTLGRDHVEAMWTDGKRIIARADFLSSIVFECKLNVISSPASHERHADISGWPANKEEQLALAQNLAFLCPAAQRRPTA